MNLKRLALHTLLTAVTATAFAQDFDDIYFDPKTDAPKTKVQKPKVVKETVDYLPADLYTPTGYDPGASTRDIDEYNRRGIFAVGDTSATSADTTGTEAFAYTSRLRKFHNSTAGSNDVEVEEYLAAGSASPVININVIEPGYFGYGAYPYYWNTPYYYDPFFYGTWGVYPGWGWGPSYAWGWRPSYAWGYNPWSWGWGPSWSWGWGSWGPSWSWGWGGGWYPSRPNRPNHHPGGIGGSTHRPQRPASGRRPSADGYQPGSGRYPSNNSGYRPGYNGGNNRPSSIGRPAQSGNNNNGSYTRPRRDSNTNSRPSYSPSGSSSRGSGYSGGGGGGSRGGGGRGRH